MTKEDAERIRHAQDKKDAENGDDDGFADRAEKAAKKNEQKKKAAESPNS